MYTYAYQARDNHGKIIAGIQDAINEDNAITSLMSRGLMVLTISQKSARQEDPPRPRASRKPTSSSSPASSPP